MPSFFVLLIDTLVMCDDENVYPRDIVDVLFEQGVMDYAANRLAKFQTPKRVIFVDV